MESDVLKDKSVKPTDEIVFSIIGDKQIIWKQVMAYLHKNHNDISEVWNYYNDGKSWLLRVLKKKKTLFWIKVLNDTFRIAFWFGDKAEPVIGQSDLLPDIKNDFKNAKRYGKLRCIYFDMSDSVDMDDVIRLIEVKLKVK
jgi:hypothetical protein